MNLYAKTVPYSSIVGQSIMLTDGKDGRVICQLAMLLVAHDREASQKIAEEVTRRINEIDYSSLEVRAAMHLMTRWVKTSERQPKVGGSYITGDYINDGVLPRRFDRSHNRYMVILETGPTWRELEEDIHGRQVDRTIEPPEYWLENMPPHPEYVP